MTGEMTGFGVRSGQEKKTGERLQTEETMTVGESREIQMQMETEEMRIVGDCQPMQMPMPISDKMIVGDFWEMREKLDRGPRSEEKRGRWRVESDGAEDGKTCTGSD